MSWKLKNHIASRVVSFFKPHEEALSRYLPRFMRINGSEGPQNIELHLDLRYLRMSTDTFSVDFKKLTTISPDILIKNATIFESRDIAKVVFSLHTNKFAELIVDGIVNKQDDYRKRNGILSNPPGTRVVVEFSSPNIAKPFHVGHLRSTIIGNFISKIHEYLTFDVVKLNYLGDWGTQMGMLAVGLDILQFSDDLLKANPMRCLYEAYVRAHEEAEQNPEIHLRAKKIFKEMETDSDELNRWKLLREYSMNELNNTYRRLGIKYDSFHSESMYRAKDLGHIIELLKMAELVEINDDGQHMVILNKKKVPIVKSDGTMLYLTRDIAAAIDRHMHYNFHQMIYVVENGQNDHMETLFETLKKLNLPWAYHLKHIKFGRIHGMSTRKGKVVFLKDVLDEAKSIMKKKQENSATTRENLSENTADILGMSAVIINDLKQRRLKDYEFKWDKVLQVQGDTGIRLQYTHCRLWSLEKNCGVELAEEFDPSIVHETEAIILIMAIARFDDVLLQSYENLEACHLVQYLFQLCNAINRAFVVLHVKYQDPKIASQRILLFHAARIVLNKGMRILGLQPLQEM